MHWKSRACQLPVTNTPTEPASSTRSVAAPRISSGTIPIDDSTKAHGLGSEQIYVLHQLARNSPLSVHELAELTVTDQSSVSVVVNKLVEKGFVSRARSEEMRVERPP